MPKKTEEVTVPMSKQLDELIVEPLGYGDHKSKRIRELIREGLVAEGVNPERIPNEDDQRTKEADGGSEQAQLAD
jgi:hypothetical protein